jgi:hypothetical protein
MNQRRVCVEEFLDQVGIAGVDCLRQFFDWKRWPDSKQANAVVIKRVRRWLACPI